MYGILGRSDSSKRLFGSSTGRIKSAEIQCPVAKLQAAPNDHLTLVMQVSVTTSCMSNPRTFRYITMTVCNEATAMRVELCFLSTMRVCDTRCARTQQAAADATLLHILPQGAFATEVNK